MARFTLTPQNIVGTPVELTGTNAAILGQVQSLDGSGTVPTLSRNTPNEVVVNFGRIDTTDNSTGTILESGILDTTVQSTIRVYVSTTNRQGNLQGGGNACNCIVDQIVGTRTGITVFNGVNSANYISGPNTGGSYELNYNLPSGTNSNLLDYSIAITHNAGSYGGGSNNRRWLTIDLIELEVEVIELVPPGKSQAIWV